MLVANFPFQFPNTQRGENQPAGSFQPSGGHRSGFSLLGRGSGALARTVGALLGFSRGNSFLSFFIASGWVEMGHGTMTAFSISRAKLAPQNRPFLWNRMKLLAP